MAKISPEKIEEGGNELSCLSGWLDKIQESLNDLQKESAASDEEWPPEALRHLQAAAEIFESQARNIKRDSDALFQCARLYGQAQNRVCDIYQGEIPVIPRTRFQISYFDGLKVHAGLLPISRGRENAEKEPGRETPMSKDLGQIL